jgi:hypothetical protein
LRSFNNVNIPVTPHFEAGIIAMTKHIAKKVAEKSHQTSDIFGGTKTKPLTA